MKVTTAKGSSNALPWVLAAFGVGFACALSMTWYSGRPAPQLVVTQPIQPDPHPERRTVVALQIEADSANVAMPAASLANPFSREPLRESYGRTAYREFVLPRPTSQQYVSVAALPRVRAISPTWVANLRSSCTRRAPAEKEACEKLAAAVERILVSADDDAALSWANDMRERLERLLADSARAADLSLIDVRCNGKGCFLYWNSTDYADWRKAGDALLRDLKGKAWFREFAGPRERTGDFDPMTSTPWELLVLERQPPEPPADRTPEPELH
jgi:hypothetical protein